jgi:tRNA(Ile)-lysidine synthase
MPDVFAPGARLLVAFSGGQDSTCMLHALAHRHPRLDLLAAHVDHGLRADSAAAAQRVEALANDIGVSCEVVRVDVGAYRVKRASVQQAARAARYTALAQLARTRGAAAVVVAHTADDQAETVLLNLVRGTGLLGLAGMRIDEMLDVRRLSPSGAAGLDPVERVRLVRPLLEVGRPTTLAYCAHFGLNIVEDASNQTRLFTRNRVRLDLLPHLEQFNPAIREVLARTADLVAEDVAVIENLVGAVQVRLEQGGAYDLQLFRAQPRGLQRRLLRRALLSQGVGMVDVSDAPIEDALELVASGRPNQTYHLPYGVELCLGSHTFALARPGRARQRDLQKSWDVRVPRV